MVLHNPKLNIVKKNGEGKKYSPFYKSPIGGLEFIEFLNDRNLQVLERFRSEIENADDPIIAVDLNLRIIFLNSLAKRFFPAQATKFSKLSLESHLQIEDADGKNMSWNDLLRMGLLMGINLQKNVRLPNGTTRPLLLTGSPLFDSSGDLIGFVTQLKKISTGKLEKLYEVDSLN